MKALLLAIPLTVCSAFAAELDNVTIWSIKPDQQPGWSARRDTLPKFEPVPIVKKNAK